ncbi:sterol esterase from carbohydrate esterase family CE10 [Postia placenta Mad-698-R]|uniref:Carboxylic ester hydrolase n=1 Tax=Postia placenta MAD-698-R-SB12 TaxID=670580 RepID=A0A1X6MQ89_9APHY|nr:hypothetical protein POSPLADRAFT_1153171 [Postia placenta MAD-698-R-SB12]EED79829.1 sterol esterase from carbohydrate esterase family CE10 [Postia placenta Mad-698-R]OSX58558.1 hypothetical protein POSPLADRAFT_1153171 [Postia placenta MAD-698-R-SB12]
MSYVRNHCTKTRHPVSESIGPLRFAPPQWPEPFTGIRQAISYGPACPQQPAVTPDVLPITVPTVPAPSNQSEDCLYLNVIKPVSAVQGDNLPVLFYIFGGGFETGDSSFNPGNTIVNRSVQLDQPVIFVSINYRLTAFGFIAGEEIQKAGASNLGIRDQRLAMQWVNRYISAFGGDPNKVIIWGESAGALSVGLHMVINNGDPGGLYRGAFMESGSPYALRNYTAGQPFYNMLVESTGCSGETDTLACLRQVPFRELWAAVNATPSIINYTSLNFAWQPRLDGDLFSQNPMRSVSEGSYAKVPMVTGDCDDEGTVFSLGNINVTTDAEFLAYIHQNYLPLASSADIADVATAYPEDPIYGSPFGTGDLYNITPEYKRMAAFQGDWEFQSPRRYFLEVASKTQDAWAFLSRRMKSTPYLGSFHSSDLPEFFTDVDFIGVDSLINFATNLNPNAPPQLCPNISYLSKISWEQWATDALEPPLLTFQDPAPSVNITADTYRKAPMALLSNLALQFP